MTRVLIVEDQKMAQENMEAIVQSSTDYILAGTISNAADAELVCMHKPVDLILMDVCTAYDESGIEACAIIKKKHPKIKVINGIIFIIPFIGLGVSSFLSSFFLFFFIESI